MSTWPPIAWSLNLPFTVSCLGAGGRGRHVEHLVGPAQAPADQLVLAVGRRSAFAGRDHQAAFDPAQPGGRSHWIALLERTVVFGEVENAERIGPFGVAETRLLEPATPT